MVDTPAAVRSPVLHGVLESIDHLMLIVRADRDALRILAMLDGTPAGPA